MPPDPAAFVRANTVLAAPPLVPEIRLHLATEITPLWLATEATLAATGLPPPYWAFAWAGGQALARHVLDHPHLVRGRRVSMSARVRASSPSPPPRPARPMSPRSRSTLSPSRRSRSTPRPTAPPSRPPPPTRPRSPRRPTSFLSATCATSAPLAARLVTWLARRAAAGALVLLGDPGRAYLPRAGLEECARYTVPTPLDLEDRDKPRGGGMAAQCRRFAASAMRPSSAWLFTSTAPLRNPTARCRSMLLCSAARLGLPSGLRN